MARMASGKEFLEQAKAFLAKARTVDELRQAQAVVLPANSGSNWTLIPRQTGQPFQSKLDTDSTANWTVK